MVLYKKKNICSVGAILRIAVLAFLLMMPSSQGQEIISDNATANKDPKTCDTTTTTTSQQQQLTIALLATTLKVPDLVAWLHKDALLLHGRTFVVPTNIATYLLESDDAAHIGSKLDIVEQVPTAGADIAIAAKALTGQVASVVVFWDENHHQQGVAVPDLHMLARACDVGQVPLAINEAGAQVMVRGGFPRRMAYLIFNPVAGQRDPQEDLKTIYSILEPAMTVTVILTKPDVDPAEQAREVIDMIKSRPGAAENNEVEAVIVASGGDGTVSAIAGATINSGIPFGVIPRGTANAFSVALGIPTDVEGACKNILRGNVRVIDGAMCNDTPMILLAGIGFEAGMVENAPRELKNVAGPLAYIYGGVKQFFTQESFQCTFEVDGEIHEARVGAVTVATVAPPTSIMAQGMGECIPDDGLLDITVGVADNFADGLRGITTLVSNAVMKTPSAESSSSSSEGTIVSARVKELTVTCDPPQTLVIDGELVQMNPVKFTVLPGAIRVIAPPASELLA